MRANLRCILLGCFLLSLLIVRNTRADDEPCVPDHTLQRAGNPQIQACYAVPSDTGAYVGYPVGGGCAVKHCADLPHPEEGTWGWDYQGRCLPRRVFLGWWHGRCPQGGTGAYKTEGPHFVKCD